MIGLADIRLARQVGCTTATVGTEAADGHDAVFVTRRRPYCGKPAVWLCEWLNTYPDARTELVLGAACPEHHQSAVSGEHPLLDSSHQPVEPDWYRLPEDPSTDAAWLAELLAAANPEREAVTDE